jgi:imidazolonepropionase-like amidohydrolase
MDRDAALRAVTLTPAEMLGVADTHGSLEIGKTANVVVWSGDPFEPLTSVEHVFIGGTEMPDDSRQKRLLRRYDDLGDRPPAYDDGS